MMTNPKLCVLSGFFWWAPMSCDGHDQSVASGGFSSILQSMIHWYRVVIESDQPVEAEERAASFELALRASLQVASVSNSVRVYYDWLPARRGRVFWLSAAAFEAAGDLARQQGAEPFPGLADMRYLVPMFD